MKEEVEKILRYGAYDFFAHEKESSSFDFDKIMNEVRRFSEKLTVS